MSILQNINRSGNFSSSEIYKLLKKTTVQTYVRKKNQERRLGRSIQTESNARPLTWGKTLEARVFDLLGLEYSLLSLETVVHPEYNFWCGSADGMKSDKGRTIMDIKCPITLDSFCDLVDPLYDGLKGMEAMNAVRENHKDGEKYYWQLVSNAILNDCDYAELIVYMPYESEIPEIKKDVDGIPNCYWIAMAGEDELPFIKDGGFYKNLNIIRFEVPEEDKILLTENVIKAGKMLVNNPSVILAEFDSSVNATIIE